MPDNAGMIFVPATAVDMHMWMKDTLIPLDMLFFDNQGQVIYIHKNARPNDLTPISSGQVVRGVIELKGGTCDRLQIDVGSRIKF